MAVLSGHATGFPSGYHKYIQRSRKPAELKLTIEKNLKNVPIYDKKGNVIALLKAGDQLGTLVDTNLYSVPNAKSQAKWSGTKYFLKFKIKIKGKIVESFVSIYFIRKPTGIESTTVHEDAVVEGINEYLNSAIPPRNLIIKGIYGTKLVLKNPFKAVQLPGAGRKSAKADIKIIDRFGRPLAFFSHKAGKGAKAFQQYSGITKESGTKISTHPEVVNFTKKVYNITGGLLKNKDRFARKLTNKKLIGYIIFGKDYTPSILSGGPFNCHFLAQGKVFFEPHNNGIDAYMKFEHHVIMKSEEKFFVSGEYEPVLQARFQNTMTRAIGQPPYKTYKARGGIFPAESAGMSVAKFI